MPSTAIAPSPKTRSPRRRQTENHSTPTRRVDLKRAFGEAGEAEYGRLLRVLRAAQGRFVLLPIESDLDYDTREAFLQRLGKDLSARDISLQTVQLSRTSYDVLTELNAANTADVVALIGLEETPGIALEAGAPPQRPPAVAMLNQGREALRKSLHAPLLLWCDPQSYGALQEHAPDFFDHFTSIFTFLDAAPAPAFVEPQPEWAQFDLSRPEFEFPLPPPASLAFYEEQVARFTEPSEYRARALIGLATSLWPKINAQDKDTHLYLKKAEEAIQEALILLPSKEAKADLARAQVMCAALLKHHSIGDHERNIHLAIGLLKSAASIYHRLSSNQDQAFCEMLLGNRFQDLKKGDRRRNLQHAISYYEAALEFLTPEQYPLLWRGTKMGLGHAYRELPPGGKKNLRRAISHYEDALKVCDENDNPQTWAVAQLLLGSIYSTMKFDDPIQNWRKAVAHYEALAHLEERDELFEEQEIALRNLAALYYSAPTGNPQQNLQQAIAYFERGLQRTKPHSKERADILYGLGMLWTEWAKHTQCSRELVKARESFVAAAQIFSHINMISRAQETAEKIADIEKVLKNAQAALAGATNNSGETEQSPATDAP